MDTLIDQSIARIREAVRLIGKKPLADRAGVSDAILHNLADADYSPTARTLRKLERAAGDVLAKRCAVKSTEVTGTSVHNCEIFLGCHE